ncbi:MAG: PINc/VapC family ATPase [archaeon]
MKEKAKKIIPDTSIIIEGLLSKKIEKKELKPEFVIVHEAVVAELEAQANRNREVGYLGLEELKKLRELSKKNKFVLEFKGSRPDDFEIKHAKAGEIDSIIRRLAQEEKGTLMTGDKVQALVAESKGIDVILIEFEVEQKPLALEKYFDKDTMSVHIKENCIPKAKKGVPGNWRYVAISKKPIDAEEIRGLAKGIIEETKIRKDGFMELERRGSSIIQLSNYRIVITRPPFSDGYEITAVRPIKKLSLGDYKISEKLKERISQQAEGILIAGAPGHGKTTFAQSLAEYYAKQDKVVKTVEAPRDLVLPDEITQYSISHGSSQEIHDILLLSRPDYTIFDEMRNTDDFRLFSDLRLSGVGMIGVIHATKPIDAIQRFIGRIELGVIPHIVDTVIFIKNGQVDRVFSLDMEVKMPSGMTEADLARPVVVVYDFETGKLEFEIYTYGEETVVIPVKIEQRSPAMHLAEQQIKQEFMKYSDNPKVEMVNANKCIVYVRKHQKSSIIGRNGSNIEKIERHLGVSIDVREIDERTREIDDQIKMVREDKKQVNYDVSIHKSNITFALSQSYVNSDVDIYLDGDYLLTARTSKKSIIKIAKNNKIGRMIVSAVNRGEKLGLFV